MRRLLSIIPIMTFFANIAILLNIPILREIVVFIFLSFIPGFAVLRLFKLKDISLLDIFLLSVALSIAFVMFMGLLVNELYLFLGLSHSISMIPLTLALSAFTLTVFFFEYKRELSETSKLKITFKGEQTNIYFLSILLFVLPVLSALGVLYLSVSLILISDVIIAFLCIISVVSRRLIPEKLFPFLIFSISIALICQVLLTSKYIVGYDANLEYYVFRLTQINGHWGFLDATFSTARTQAYDSMLSVTLLPAIYSSLMNSQGEIVFKVLYSFIFACVPLTLYRICEKQFGKLIGLLSALFFVFTSAAFYDPEALSLNRQMVGALFLLLSIFLLINKTIPVTKRRLLLITFGGALVVSHYALAYIYLAIITLVFIISRVKHRFDATLNIITVLLLFGVTFSWYSLGPRAPLISLTNIIIARALAPTAGTAATSVFAFPQIFTFASWTNLLLSGIANFFLILGFLSIILRPKGKGISSQYFVMTILGAILLFTSFIAPTIASILNFSRFYGITLLFLSPCFVFGGKTFLGSIEKIWKKIRRLFKCQGVSKNKNYDRGILLIAIILGGYFLSQVGFVNFVTNGAVHSYNTDFYSLLESNNSQAKLILYNVYIPDQDVFSATWLLNHKVGAADVFGDYLSAYHVLVCYGLIQSELILPITNTTIPPQGSFVYLGSLNLVNGVITTSTGSFKTSEISSLLDQNNVIYSNGDSEILSVVTVR